MQDLKAFPETTGLGGLPIYANGGSLYLKVQGDGNLVRLPLSSWYLPTGCQIGGLFWAGSWLTSGTLPTGVLQHVGCCFGGLAVAFCCNLLNMAGMRHACSAGDHRWGRTRHLPSGLLAVQAVRRLSSSSCKRLKRPCCPLVLFALEAVPGHF